MQYCIWTVAGQRYATPAHQVVEIVPLVSARPMAQAPAWISGLMNYRGDLLPLVDVSTLLDRGPIQPRRAARILVLEVQDQAGEITHLGLLVEHLEDIESIEFSPGAGHPGLAVSGAEYLGPVAGTASGTVQLVELEHLLTEEHRQILFQRHRKMT